MTGTTELQASPGFEEDAEGRPRKTLAIQLALAIYRVQGTVLFAVSSLIVGQGARWLLAASLFGVATDSVRFALRCFPYAYLVGLCILAFALAFGLSGALGGSWLPPLDIGPPLSPLLRALADKGHANFAVELVLVFHAVQFAAFLIPAYEGGKHDIAKPDPRRPVLVGPTAPLRALAVTAVFQALCALAVFALYVLSPNTTKWRPVLGGSLDGSARFGLFKEVIFVGFSAVMISGFARWMHTVLRGKNPSREPARPPT